MVLFSRVTLTPLKVSKAGKSPSRSEVPNVVDGDSDNNGNDSDKLTRLVPVYVRESEADAICEVAGLVSTIPSKVVGDDTAGLAGLASAGEERAELQSLLAMETALFSITVSLLRLSLTVVGKGGAEEGTVGGGPKEKISLKLLSISSIACGSFMDVRSGSVAGITNCCARPTSLDT